MYTWEQWVDEVIVGLTDRQPDDDLFTEAQAAYVRARMASELAANADLYALHQNRYTALRRKLVGYTTTLEPAAQQTAVRTLITDVVPDNNLFIVACAYWIKAHLTAEINRNAAEGGNWLGRYKEMRTKLLGYSHSYANLAALEVEVKKLMLVDGLADNGSTFQTAQLAAAVSDLQGLASWFNAQVAAAAADLTGLRARVLKEIRAGAIELQNFIDAYRVGHTTVFKAEDVTASGAASRGLLPEQARLREVWVTYPDELGDTSSRRVEAVRIPWELRHTELICGEGDRALIAYDPGLTNFLVTPALVADEVELEIVYDGLKFDFSYDDTVPFDEGAAVAVRFYVNSKMGLELGDPIQTVREYERHFRDRLALLYIEAKDRAEMPAMIPVVPIPAQPIPTEEDEE